MLSKNVFIVNPNAQYESMFSKRGWRLATDIINADLIQFTGGEDVHPSMYNTIAHQRTQANLKRDLAEQVVFKFAQHGTKREDVIPTAGICRGGQFLNVMCGGRMWQDVDGHLGKHPAHDVVTGECFQVTSTHHQMMDPHVDALTLVTAAKCKRKEGVSPRGVPTGVHTSVPLKTDVEVVFYKEQQSLCFQPHPEFPNEDVLADRYFNYIEEYLF